MKTLITGATGFIGKHVIQALKKRGHEISILTRDPVGANKKINIPCHIFKWEPEKNLIPEQAFHNMDAIVHLAGENIAGGRWTKSKKNKIERSRVLATNNLIKHVKALKTKPNVIVSASAIGFYGDNGENLIDETSPPSEGFLSQVCQSWEKEILQIAQKEIRTVSLRIGVVLGHGGGAMKQILLPFRFALGGRLGKGNQWMSWIHVEDLAEMFAYGIENTNLNGVYNAVSPSPVTNLEFTKTLSQVINQPAELPVPAFALKIIFGEMSEILLNSQRVSNEKISKAGFKYKFKELKCALEDICEQEKPIFSLEQWCSNS